MDDTSKKFLHDRLVLLLITITAALLVIGLASVLLRFDPSKNPTTIVAHSSVFGDTAGKPIDIYSLAIFMVVSSLAAVALSARVYTLRRSIAMFILSSNVFLLVLAIRVAWSIVNKQ